MHKTDHHLPGIVYIGTKNSPLSSVSRTSVPDEITNSFVFPITLGTFRGEARFKRQPGGQVAHPDDRLTIADKTF